MGQPRDAQTPIRLRLVLLPSLVGELEHRHLVEARAGRDLLAAAAQNLKPRAASISVVVELTTRKVATLSSAIP